MTNNQPQQLQKIDGIGTTNLQRIVQQIQESPLLIVPRMLSVQWDIPYQQAKRVLREYGAA